MSIKRHSIRIRSTLQSLIAISTYYLTLLSSVVRSLLTISLVLTARLLLRRLTRSLRLIGPLNGSTMQHICFLELQYLITFMPAILIRSYRSLISYQAPPASKLTQHYAPSQRAKVLTSYLIILIRQMKIRYLIPL